MASIHKHKGSKFWFAAWRGEGGRLFFRSTKQTDRSKATAVALQYERAAKLAMAGELTEVQARDVLNDILKAVNTGEHLRAPSVAEHFRHWLDAKETRRGAPTAERYKIAVDRFLTMLGERAKRPLTSLTARDVDRFLESRMKEGLAPRTVVLDVKVIRSILSHARRQGIIQHNPAEAVELPAAEGVERGTFTPEEVKMLVDAAEGEWKTIIMLGYFTGARLGDCCGMMWDSVNFANGVLTFTASKTGKPVAVPLHPDLQAHLEELASTDKAEKYLTPHMAGLKPGGRHGLSEGFKRIMRTAGLDLQQVQGGGVRKLCRRSFHALRHSFTSALANAGVAPELRMKLTGHRSEAAHKVYSHHELAVLRSAVEKLPSLSATSSPESAGKRTEGGSKHG